MKKRICLLGSTGSIGNQAIEVIREHSDKFEITAIAVMRSIDALEEQIYEFKPAVAVVFDEAQAKLLKSRITATDTKILTGMEGLIEAATHEEVDMVLNSVVGSVGLQPTLMAIRSKKDIALANKETLVVAGGLIMEEVKKSNVNIVPVDSEHSAIFQCLQGQAENSLSKILLTASGGPFREWAKEDIAKADYRAALKHPNWSMGRKISIDSATLMNKGLEVIEAKWLFNLDVDKIEVVVHPQSIIHSMVEFQDYSVIAQLGMPDMKLPIQYALTYPRRYEGKLPRLSFSEVKELSFRQPDLESFPCLRLAYEAIAIGGTMPCVLNGANEELVQYYLQEKIGFYDISKYIEKAIAVHQSSNYSGIEELLEVDAWVRSWIRSQIS